MVRAAAAKFPTGSGAGRSCSANGSARQDRGRVPTSIFVHSGCVPLTADQIMDMLRREDAVGLREGAQRPPSPHCGGSERVPQCWRRIRNRRCRRAARPALASPRGGRNHGRGLQSPVHERLLTHRLSIDSRFIGPSRRVAHDPTCRCSQASRRAVADPSPWSHAARRGEQSQRFGWHTRTADCAACRSGAGPSRPARQETFAGHDAER